MKDIDTAAGELAETCVKHCFDLTNVEATDAIEHLIAAAMREREEALVEQIVDGIRTWWLSPQTDGAGMGEIQKAVREAARRTK